MTGKDTIYSQSHHAVADFVFDDTVAAVFPDMISRSVPGYPAILNMIQLLTAEHAQAGSRLYDLGCSLGASTLAMEAGLSVPGCRIIAVDNAAAMIERARQSVRSDKAELRFVQDDIRAVPIEDASVVVLNFTLQFLPRDGRAELLN
ncbi:MAG: methyltransferase domain-containing protein, partial [Gammaproteobacteria bacterium]